MSCVIVGTYGYDGYKGCVGAEFFRCDGFPATLTEEECETFTLGMTRAEAEVFLSEGSLRWSQSRCPNPSYYCMEDKKVWVSNFFQDNIYPHNIM